MSEASFITSCPECKTRFSVNAGQLKIAAGKVRCGVCLQVFEAKPAISPERKSSTAKPMAPASSAKPARSSSQSQPLTASRDDAFNRHSPSLNTASKPKLYIPVEKISVSTSPAPSNKISLPNSIAAGFSLVLIVLLLFQVAWFKRTDWLNNPTLRPLYAPFYELAEVPMPPRAAPNLIRAYQLTLQPHEQHQEALRISLLLENNASFAQPFPSMQLEFMDVKGRLIAQRLFTATEYINAQLFPEQLIPTHQPIQIQLDILNPGRRAVSYQVKLIPDSKNG